MAKNDGWVLEADPKKPYKTYAAMASAFLSSLLVSGVPLPVWVKALIASLVAALAVYLTGNPLRVKKSASSFSGKNNDETLF